MIQVGTIWPLCVNFIGRVSRSNSVHQQRQQQTLKRHIEVKHPASLSRYVWENKKSKHTANHRQITLTTYSSGSAVFISQPQLDNLVLQYIVRELWRELWTFTTLPVVHSLSVFTISHSSGELQPSVPWQAVNIRKFTLNP